ncbi:MAG: AbrB/MazE/SpoVT family DNA-binding domain-containing protein, partial [Nitrososphaerales archaeon]
MVEEIKEHEPLNYWTRRIQFSGKSSYIIALPKRWVDEMKLKAGSELTVARYGPKALIITHRDHMPTQLKDKAVI